MIDNKHITKIVAVLMAAAVCLCFYAMYAASKTPVPASSTGVTMAYETALFDTEKVIDINILMDGNDWQEMLDHATSENYYPCDVEVNGDTFYRVGIRPKGNTSLSHVASDPDNDRYSLKLEFDHYTQGQTCFGLDKLVLNNNFADATNMKEALIFDMYRYIGADASLYNYAKLSVNGEYWGVYLALEAVEDSFMLRNYGVESGNLYKPDSMDIEDKLKEGFGDGKEDAGFQPGDRPNMPQGMPDMPQGGPDMPTMPDMPQSGPDMPQSGFGMGTPPDGIEITGKSAEGFGGGKDGFRPDNMDDLKKKDMDARKVFGMGGKGSDLNYTDDSPESYQDIWDSEVNKTSKSDHKRVITALKNISQGTELETYMDTDNLLKYAAVHIISVNEDSISGSMTHNYYLYENDGRLNLLPWDYNLSLGGMGQGGMPGRDEVAQDRGMTERNEEAQERDKPGKNEETQESSSGKKNSGATSTINAPIDNAFRGTNFFDTLLADETYHTQYYANLQKLTDDYLLGEGFQTFYKRTRSLIDELVKTDPNALYSYEEYEKALDTLCEVIRLRGESIQGQLAGTIPSTSAAQSGSDALIDASHIDLSVMGTMEMGGKGDFRMPK